MFLHGRNRLCLSCEIEKKAGRKSFRPAFEEVLRLGCRPIPA